MKAKLANAAHVTTVPMAQCCSLIQAARHQACSLLFRARKRAISYAQGLRKRAKRQGYDSGLRSANEQFARLSIQLQLETAEHLRRLEQQSIELAFTVAESIVGSEILRNISVYREWLGAALLIMKNSHRLILLHNPRTAEQVRLLTQDLGDMLTTAVDPELEETELRLKSERGTVTFCWRDTLHAMLQSKSATV